MGKIVGSLSLFLAYILSVSCVNNRPEALSIMLPENVFITDDSHISVNVSVDSLSFNFLFDTGASGKLIVSDSVALMLGITDSLTMNSKLGYGFSPYPPLKVKKLANSSLTVTIGGRDLTYDEVIIDNSIITMGTDGIVSIPKGDNHVWHLNFDKMRLDLLDSIPASQPSECRDYIFDVYEHRGNYFISDLAMTFVSNKSEKTYNYTNDYMFDTGSPYEIVLMGQGGYKGDYEKFTNYLVENSFNFEYRILSGKEILNNKMYYAIENKMVGDTVQVISQENSQSGFSVNILGMSFIYRYNVIIDLYSNKLLLTKRNHSKEFNETVLSICGANMDTYSTTKRTDIVTDINPESELYVAGIRRFDEINEIISKPGVGNSSKIYKMAEKGDTLYFSIIRNGNKLRIPVIK